MVAAGKCRGCRVKHREKPGGVLAGEWVGPRKAAILAHNAGFRDDDLFTAVAVCGAESWLYTKARNDNTALITALAAGQVVCNVETYEKTTIVDAANGKVQLSDGETVTVPRTTRWITSRDCGLWQINIAAGEINTAVEEVLYDPARNAAAAFKLWQRRGFEPWVAYTGRTYLNDTYTIWAAMGAANRWAELEVNAAVAAGKTSKVRVPFVSIPQIRVIYPKVPLG